MRTGHLLAVGLLCFVVCAPLCVAGDLGFPEKFALAEDREAVLKELIPGTEDHYYYHALYYQHEGDFDKVEKMLPLWIKRYKHSARVEEIRNRQALLLYGKDSKKSLDFLRWRLGLHFNHQKEVLGRKPTHPTRLDPKLISRETLYKRALSRYRNLQGLENHALAWAAARKLDAVRLRDLLHRLQRPDLPNLPQLVHAELKDRHSRGFGALGIHRKMLRSQLDELLKLRPDLKNNTHFIHTYIARLHPGPDVDWQHDPKIKQAYLERLWGFVGGLAPAHNSLKACVLYDRLVLDRSLGVYDKDRFMLYLKLPRNAGYVNPGYLTRHEHRRYRASLGADYRRVTLLPPVGNDEPLVRSYLMQFFVKEDSYKPYETYVRDTYLKPIFAETKIVHGIGDMERWYSMISPQQVKALKDRVDIDFAYTNATTFGADAEPALDLHVKNVKTLLVKVFEINTLNFYREKQQPVGIDVNLDGLVANEESVVKYDDPPLRRVKRTFRFPKLKKRGVYVVEFIGNGKSSRALIRKGELRYLERTSLAGHVFTILDESNRKVNDAELYLGGHRYAADEEGRITVPFSTRPGQRTIVLRQGDFAWLDRFAHRAETYQLSAGFHVDRESLLKRNKTQLLVRPSLQLHGTLVSLELLEEVRLSIVSVDRDGVSSTKDIPDFKLQPDKESVYTFQTPENLSKLQFALRAKVKSLTQNKEINLSASGAFTINQIDRTEKVEDLHLACLSDGYAVDLLGKTGEVKADRPVYVVLKHRDFRQTVTVTLKSDPKGRARLGALQDITWVSARGPEGTQHRWMLPKDRCQLPGVVHGKAGETLRVPHMGSDDVKAADAVSLLEVCPNGYLRDCVDSVRIRNGFVEISDLSAGDYSLRLKDSGTEITVRLTKGEDAEGYVLSDYRQLQKRNAKPLQIEPIAVDEDTITVQLWNPTKYTRVHVAATRFVPEHRMESTLRLPGMADPVVALLPTAETQYQKGRKIGDEYRYILERKYAKKFPGNMLRRPELLLNPWAVRKTDAGRQEAARGGHWGRGAGHGGRVSRHGGGSRGKGVRGDGFTNLDFLGEPSVVLANLRPDKKGRITIERKTLGAHQDIHVLAADPLSTVSRRVRLPEPEATVKDLTLANGLDPSKHYTEQKHISVVKADETFVLKNITTSKVELYDTLPKVYRLYTTLSGNATLAEFSFLLRWPTMKVEEKRELYTKYACHELHLFLYHKDRAFFDEVIEPYLKNKKDTTFVDRWLLEEDLAEYAKPWAFGQLNVVERILLGRRIRAESDRIPRHVKDRYDLIPPNVERFNHLFRTALKGSALDTSDSLGLGKKKQAALARGRRAVLAERLSRDGDFAAKSGSVAPAPDNGGGRAPRKSESKRVAEPAVEMEEMEDAPVDVAADDDAFADVKMDFARRKKARVMFRKLDKTQEWAENNYYHLTIGQQNAGLVTPNAFWKDYAQHDGRSPFFSTNLAEASRNFTEMMLALSVLDLPFEAKEHKSAFDEVKMTLTAGSPAVVFHREVREAEPLGDKTPVLVSQNFFRLGDRYRHVNNERFDKYVTEEFLQFAVYGCQVVLTNPTSSRQKLDVLMQVPMGALPVKQGFYTRSVHIRLEPYSTRSFEYHFYFPGIGQYAHYPVHVGANEKLVASADPVTLNVVEKLSQIDKTAWDYVSQHGSPDDVLEHLETQNVDRLKLARIAWRMRDRNYFGKVLRLLNERHVYDNTLWSYSIYHDELQAIREYLQHSNGFVRQCGQYIDAKPLTIDPVVRKTYEHLEYSPLVNARAHPLGKVRRIVNGRFYQQYMRLMTVLRYRPKLDDSDWMAVTYYLLLQDRVEEALKSFAKVSPRKLPTRLQHDYMKAYLAFSRGKPEEARKVARRYAEYPVDRWRKIFGAVLGQCDEIAGKAARVVDDEDRTQQQTKLAATEPSLDLKVESRKILLNYQNVKQCAVNYYKMDIELLFSRNPFVQNYSGQFSYIRPNHSAVRDLPADGKAVTFDLPEQFQSSNVMVEVSAGGMKRAATYTAHRLGVQVIENYGQVRVAEETTGKALSTVYVKVYARMKNGQVKFYKDGYTDLRGRFDYVSLNTNELDNVARFSLLIMSETHGAVIREAAPPKR